MAVKEVGLYRSSSTRIYHPSSHTFRHLLMKQKYEESTDISEVARYFGEKETRNIMYYLTSNFHLLTGDGENQAQS